MTTTIKHILVVGDAPALRALYQAFLERFDYTSEISPNGREALAKLAHVSYDAILLDYMMPGAPGLTVLEDIQRCYPSIPVAMVTGVTPTSW